MRSGVIYLFDARGMRRQGSLDATLTGDDRGRTDSTTNPNCFLRRCREWGVHSFRRGPTAEYRWDCYCLYMLSRAPTRPQEQPKHPDMTTQEPSRRLFSSRRRSEKSWHAGKNPKANRDRFALGRTSVWEQETEDTTKISGGPTEEQYGHTTAFHSNRQLWLINFVVNVNAFSAKWVCL